MAEETISRRLSRYIDEISFADIPDDVVERAKGRLLDSLSCAFAGYNLPWSKIAVETGRQSRGKCTVLASEEKVAAMEAAYINGVLAHSILQEDTGAGGHPSTIITPAVLAVAEQEDSSGIEVLLAIVLGYDISERISLGEALSIKKGFRGTFFGSFGAAAAVGKLMGLSQDQIANAIGHVANLSSGLLETWWSGTMEAVFAAGFAAKNGIMAAVLAQAGATSAEKALEGEDGFYQAFFGRNERLDYATMAFGKDFGIMKVVEKYYPACAASQWPIETSLRLMVEYGIDPKNIESVVEYGAIPIPGFSLSAPYQNMFQAQMSHKFCIAAALLGKPVDDFMFYFNSHNDPEVADLARKISLEVGGEEHRIELVMLNGYRYSLEADQSHPLIGYYPTIESMQKKFKRLAGGYLGDEQAEMIIEKVINLDKLGSIRELSTMFDDKKNPV